MRRSAAQQAQGLIFGALMAALVIIFAFTQVLAFLIPIPLVLTYMRYGGRVAALTGAVATLFSLLFASPDVTLLQVLPMGVLPGLAMGMGFHRKWRPLYTGALTVLSFSVGFMLIYVIVRFGFFAGSDPIQQMVQMGKGFLNSLIPAVEGAMLQVTDPKQKESLQQTIKQLGVMRDTVEPFIRNLLPSLVTLAGVGFSWLNMRLCAAILPRLGYEVHSPTPFGNLRLPSWAVWGGFVALLGQPVLLLPAGTQPWYVELARNLVYAAMTIYGIAGVSVAYGWLVRRKVPRGIALLIGLIGYFALNSMLIILAAWDAIFDFRGLGHGTWGRRPAPKSKEVLTNEGNSEG